MSICKYAKNVRNKDNSIILHFSKKPKRHCILNRDSELSQRLNLRFFIANNLGEVRVTISLRFDINEHSRKGILFPNTNLMEMIFNVNASLLGNANAMTVRSKH